ncbi:SusD/RagB family nutrient-binding outer membrane lipoprotein [Cesiribacter andamanensis]|nr:SusD/RagB family nutrient-binding outer membrane lipoprotein [Cesiribacter andamanensis]
MNIDPNQPTRVPAENLLTQAQLSLNQLFWGRAANAEFAMLLVQHFAQNEYAEDSRYTMPAANFDGIWNTAYAGGLNDLEVAKTIVENNEAISDVVRANQIAVLEIMQVWAFHNLTDMFGDIPYSEALTDEPYPSYDPQSEIYPDLIRRLTEASAQIDPTAGSFSSGDNIYRGDMEQWRLLANSLKLRIAMRMSDVNSSAASTAVAQAVADGVIMTHAQAATYEFDPQAALANPLYIDQVINRRDDFSVSETLLGYMQDENDPRVSAYANPNVSGNYVGMPYGLTDAEAFARKGNTSRPNDALRQQQSEAIIMGPVEVYFLLAEAAEKGYISGDAAEYYTDALELSMDYWGVSDAEATAYIAAHPYSSANWREVIGTQKWVALYMQGLQAWAEWRRLDAPDLAFPAAADPSVSAIPVRAPYPAGEEGTNTENLAAVGVNGLATKMWWDVD